ncbi:hypothetical protein CASFOL_026541 [Castilleja foliolosa]|uniref:RING-type domain-containing protein n=1 Tax=Castilleja foliolosa TaxID=1961234 RepID=A0ABD3CJ64_9LAMI
MNRSPPPMQPETMRMLHSVIEAEPIDVNDSLSWPIDVITTVQSRDATSQISPSQEPETTRMPSPVSTETGLADISDSSGRVDFNDYLSLPDFNDILWWTTTVQSQNDQARCYLYLSWQNIWIDSNDLTDIISSPTTVQSQDDQSKGLSEGTISKYLKTMSADEIRERDIDGDRKICSVCLDDICGQSDKVAILVECRHEFHYCCLEKWLKRKNICPLCRRTAIFPLQD